MIGAKFVLITNRKSHMSFRLVPNSVTLDDLERRNSPNRHVISTNSVAFGADYVKMVEYRPVRIYAKVLNFLVRVQCRRKESSRSLSHLLMSLL